MVIKNTMNENITEDGKNTSNEFIWVLLIILITILLTHYNIMML